MSRVKPVTRLKRSFRRLLVAVGGVALLAACAQPPTPEYFPLNRGQSWVYQKIIERPGGGGVEQVTIRALGAVNRGGKEVFVRRNDDGVEYALLADASGIYRVAETLDTDRETRWDAGPRYVLKAPFAVGTKWEVPTVPYLLRRPTDALRELKYSQAALMTYTIEKTDEVIEVGGVRYERVIRVTGVGELRLFADAVSGIRLFPIKHTEWYAPGVGLIKLERDEVLNASFITGGKITMELLAHQR